jgi:hypothetical protein
MQRFNTWLALKITDGVATMWCSYFFALIALISLPAAIASRSLIIIVAWVAQTFLQLVLLSIILVGQKLQADSTINHIDKRHDTHMGEIAKLHLKLDTLLNEK